MSTHAKTRSTEPRTPTNLLLDSELAGLAKQYLPTTRHKNLSRFVEGALRSLYRKNAAKIRSAGLKVPEAAFTK